MLDMVDMQHCTQLFLGLWSTDADAAWIQQLVARCIQLRCLTVCDDFLELVPHLACTTLKRLCIIRTNVDENDTGSICKRLLRAASVPVPLETLQLHDYVEIHTGEDSTHGIVRAACISGGLEVASTENGPGFFVVRWLVFLSPSFVLPARSPTAGGAKDHS